MEPCWKVTYNDYEPEQEGLREALCTLGNGYFATRGAHEESRDDQIHYPGMYLARGYNRLKSEISGKVIENEDLVNWPNWLVLKFKPENGEWMRLDEVEVLEYRQTLNLREGILERYIHIKDNAGRETMIESKRLVHGKFQHLAAIQWKLTPKNWSGNIILHSALDGSVTNNGVARYRELQSRHLKTLKLGTFEEEGIFLKTQTLQSEIVMAQAAKVRVEFAQEIPAVTRESIQEEDYIAHELKFYAAENQEVIIEKVVAIYTSRDYAISDPLTEATTAVLRAGSFDELMQCQRNAWTEIWDRVDTRILSGHEEEQIVLRLHIFHLMQTVSIFSADLDVGVPARGWHGEAYRGHIFWDELFIFPFLTWSMPELTRSLLMYRFRRLPEARCNAEENGYAGALFPWQSGSNGREESQKIHLNPESGNWIPDDSQLQQHLNAAIAFNVWHYFSITNDLEFLHFFGAELMLDIAKFWAAKATWSEEKEKFEIRKVVGPDEYHTAYPGSNEPGIDNNAYTNVMAIWSLEHAGKVLELLDVRRREELMAHLELNGEDLQRWDKISRNMFIPFLEENKILNQFEGFEKLEELDWDHYHKKYGKVLRLDRIMEKEGDDVNKYKATKQADVLMLFYLFSAKELTALINRNGYDFDPRNIPANITYYESRAAHGSTLSKLVHSWVLARSDRGKSWLNFRQALMSDFQDVQGGTTAEGIHLGAMAGTIDLVQRGYMGLEMRNDKLWLNPQLPDELTLIEYTLRYRGFWIKVQLNTTELTLTCQGSWYNHTLEIMVKEQPFSLTAGETKTFSLAHDAAEEVR
ncbi:MAG: glycosyl hydrolase family 65 protein [Bacteroidia bacterium]